MISVSDIYKGLKKAAGLFGKIGEAERAAARKQGQLLQDLSDDLLEIRDSIDRNGRIDPFAYSKFVLAARACKDSVPELLKEIQAAETLLKTNYSAPGISAGAPPPELSGQVAEYAGAFRGCARTFLTLSGPNK